jgi:hypothetical protein
MGASFLTYSSSVLVISSLILITCLILTTSDANNRRFIMGVHMHAEVAMWRPESSLQKGSLLVAQRWLSSQSRGAAVLTLRGGKNRLRKGPAAKVR